MSACLWLCYFHAYSTGHVHQADNKTCLISHSISLVTIGGKMWLDKNGNMYMHKHIINCISWWAEGLPPPPPSINLSPSPALFLLHQTHSWTKSLLSSLACCLTATKPCLRKEERLHRLIYLKSNGLYRQNTLPHTVWHLWEFYMCNHRCTLTTVLQSTVSRWSVFLQLLSHQTIIAADEVFSYLHWMPYVLQTDAIQKRF